MGDFNLNFLNCHTDKDTSDIDAIYSHSFYPTINFPTQITLTTKALIGNIFYNTVSNNIISGDITTSVSDHFKQFLLVPDQPKDIKSHKLKEVRSLHRSDPKAFERESQRTDWSNFLQLPLRPY